MKHSASLLIQDATGAFLVIQRGGTSKHFVGMREFPGGKIDAGETPQQALVREVGVSFEAAFEAIVSGLIQHVLSNRWQELKPAASGI